MDVARAVELECVAQLCDYDRAAGADVFSGVAEGIFTAGDGFRTSGPEICRNATDTIWRGIHQIPIRLLFVLCATWSIRRRLFQILRGRLDDRDSSVRNAENKRIA